jgi:hypothetical protein
MRGDRRRHAALIRPLPEAVSAAPRHVLSGPLTAPSRSRFSKASGWRRIEPAATVQWWGRRFRLPGQAESLPHQRRSRSSNGPLKMRQFLQLLTVAAQ